MRAIMRRWIVWCVLCLLPWRLWAADVMALRACHGQPAAATAVTHADAAQHGPHGAASPHATPAAEPHAHHGLASKPSPAPHGAQPTHLGCTLCDLCHNPLGAAVPTTWSAAPIRHTWPVLRLSAPPQAARVPELRPPIA